MKKIINSKYIRSHFRAKLFILFLISGLVPAFLFLSTLYPIWYNSMKDREHTYAKDQVLLINESLDRMFQNIEKNMASIFTNTYIRNVISSASNILYADSYHQITNVEAILKSISNYSEDGYSYTLIDRSNQVFTNGSTINLLEDFDSPLCQAIKNTPSGQIYFTARYIYHSDQKQSLTFGKALTIDGTPCAVLIVDVAPHLMDTLIKTRNNQNYPAIILNSDQEIVYTNDVLSAEELDSYLSQPADHSAPIITLSDRKYEKVLAKAAFSHCTTCILIPESLIYQESFRMRWQMFFILLIILGQTFLFSNTVSFSLSRQIVHLKDEIGRFIRSRQQVPPAAYDYDEITEIEDGILYMENEIEKMILQIQEDEKRKRYLELKSLQQQINPHMIYNTLNTISKLAQLQGISNIEEVCGAFSNMLKLLSKTTGDFIKIRQEVSFIQSYITLKKYNSYQDYLLTLEIEDSVYDLPILKLLIQPFIENSILYGFSGFTCEGTILLRISADEYWIHIMIEDNGCGIPAEKLEDILNHKPKSSTGHIGIPNCIDRLRLQYDANQYFKLESDGKSFTRVELGYIYGGNNG